VTAVQFKLNDKDYLEKLNQMSAQAGDVQQAKYDAEKSADKAQEQVEITLQHKKSASDSAQAANDTVAGKHNHDSLYLSKSIRWSLINNPDVHLFGSGQSVVKLNGGLSFERDSSATYIDKNTKLLMIANANELREEAKGFLIEGYSKNLFSDRKTLNWGNTRTTTSTDATKGIDGTSDATKLTVDSALSTTHTITSPTSISVTSGETYTKSVFAKAGNGTGAGRYLQLATDSFGAWSNDGNVVFDLVGGVVSNGVGDVFTATLPKQYQMEYIGNGWYRCSIQMICNSTSTLNQEIQMSDGGNSETFNGNGSDFIYVDWAQCEQLPFASSPINSSGEPAERSADDLSIDINNLPLNDKGALSVSAEISLLHEPAELTSNAYVWGIYLGNDDHLLFKFTTSNNISAISQSSGVSAITSVHSNNVRGVPQQFTVTFAKTGLVTTYVGSETDSATQHEDTWVNHTDSDVFSVGGYRNNGALKLWGHMKDFKIWREDFTPDEVNTL